MFFGRGSLPAQFEDFIQTVGRMGLILPQPQPQFFLANAAMAGRLSAQAFKAGMSGPRALVDILGGGAQAQDPNLMRLITMAEQIPGIINVVEQFDGSKETRGDTIKFTRPVYSVGGKGENDRRIAAQVATSTTGRAASLEQTVLTLGEFWGPYASGGTGVQPFEVKQFDAEYRANKIELASTVAQQLSYDYTSWLDAVLTAKFCRATNSSGTWTSADTTYLTWPNAAWSAVTSFVAGGGALFSANQLLRAKATMKARYIPPFPNGRYVALVPTCFNTHVASDIEYRENSKYHTDGRNVIFGYVGSLQDIDIYECATLPTYAAAGTYAGGTVPTDVALAEGFICGPGAVGFGCALAPEVRFSEYTNYQTMAKLVWYAVQAQDVLDDRYVQRIVAQTDGDG